MAILLVLGEHHHVSDLWDRIGWTGVDLFFVLSGFLISGLLFSEYKRYGAIRFGRFFVRRGLKIYPGYYVLLAYFLVRDLIERRGISLHTVSRLVFLQNYVHWSGLVDYTWSLAVEEHFYVLLPLCLILLLRRHARSHDTTADPFRHLPWVVLFVACAVILLRAATAMFPYELRTHHMVTHLRIDSLLAGVLIGYWYHFHHAALRDFVVRRRRWLFATSLACLLLGVIRSMKDPWTNVLGLTSLYLGYGGILLLVLPDLSAPSRRMGVASAILDRLLAVLAFVGSYSYAIYLWHPPVQNGGMRVLGRLVNYGLPNVVIFCIYVAASVVLGVVMTKAVEAPVLRWRERFLPPRGR